MSAAREVKGAMLLCLLGVLCVSHQSASAGAFSAVLHVKEPGFDGRLRIRLYHDPDFVPVPPAAGALFLVAADSASGRDAFFIPSDLAFELGSQAVYPVEFEQTSDLLGQALGGRIRPGETQLGFVMLPPEVDLGRYLPAHPESVVVRYAHHRKALIPAPYGEAADWRTLIPLDVLRPGLNEWWDWLQSSEQAPSMNAEETKKLATTLFPGEEQVLGQEALSPEGVRNAILRVGNRRLLLEARSTQRVAPTYPAAARQVGAGGLVLALCYIAPDGTVGDAMVLASTAPHLLNLAALSAAMQWRFSTPKDEKEVAQDGWRVLPFQFRIAGAAGGDSTYFEPPQIAKAVVPQFPLEAQRRKLKGEIVYKVTIDERGKMVEAVLEQGVDPIVDKPALAALERTRFIPARRGGRPVEAELRVPFPVPLKH